MTRVVPNGRYLSGYGGRAGGLPVHRLIRLFASIGGARHLAGKAALPGPVDEAEPDTSLIRSSRATATESIIFNASGPKGFRRSLRLRHSLPGDVFGAARSPVRVAPANTSSTLTVPGNPPGKRVRCAALPENAAFCGFRQRLQVASFDYVFLKRLTIRASGMPPPHIMEALYAPCLF